MRESSRSVNWIPLPRLEVPVWLGHRSEICEEARTSRRRASPRDRDRFAVSVGDFIEDRHKEVNLVVPSNELRMKRQSRDLSHGDA
jgi:hypothetical protein